jgi:hypothetical protein
MCSCTPVRNTKTAFLSLAWFIAHDVYLTAEIHVVEHLARESVSCFYYLILFFIEHSLFLYILESARCLTVYIRLLPQEPYVSRSSRAIVCALGQW